MNYTCIYIYTYIIHIYIYTRIHSDWAVDLGPIKSPALPNSGRAMSRTGRQVSRAGSPGWSPGWSPRSPGAMAVLRIFGQNIIDNVLSWKKKENLTIMDYVINIKESIIHLSLPKFRKCWKILDINPGLLKLQMGMPNFFLFNKHWVHQRDRMIPQLGFLPSRLGSNVRGSFDWWRWWFIYIAFFSSFWIPGKTSSFGEYFADRSKSKVMVPSSWLIVLYLYIYIDI